MPNDAHVLVNFVLAGSRWRKTQISHFRVRDNGHATTPHHDFKKSLNEAVARAYAVPWGTKIISAKVHWNPGQLQQKLEPLDLLELDEAEAWDQIIGIANRGAGDLLEVTFENKQSE
ncbi:hypothetical protein MN608_10252 [Microdochium nivale]|nr:hypothetical protein MN608_10252 [Microdochium nivale]